MANRHRFNLNRLDFGDPPPERERCFGDDTGGGKAIFEDEQSALNEAARLWDSEGLKLDVYWCPHCFHWHFTKSART
ncbi:MAG: hypothetical protein WCT10_02800 [Patescibacteria group bacterium]|jgi:hypothetical protein